MLSQWLRSPARVQSPSQPRHRHFSCSSFKDIQDLCREDSSSDSGSDSPPNTPKKPSIFHRVRLSTSVLRSWSHRLAVSSTSSSRRDSDHRIILYHTSLRVVRRTFEDCRVVRSILRTLRVPIDERDLSMDSRFVDELHDAIGRKSLSLPRVFIGGRYIGGVEEIKLMNENGELKRLIERLPDVATGPAAAWCCEVCGGIRFVVCEECDGSHKIYIEKIGFRSCNSCNINGLIRCPSCSPMKLRIAGS
ncbi:uncharacterized protein At5g39865 [Cucumis sativus]|uniref:Glutaredoxin domain-containing protein n=1 Tax=Cucumis sativus TaxID=3659 RepID=A0A0A0KSF4_CUCSA|nr:uncharacterized protein At5g39865 [Cucumis sativus]